MLDVEKLLRLLNAPGYISGTALGEALGVSRVAVQKRVQALIENGLPIKAVPSKGYILDDTVTLLTEQSILTHLDTNLIDSLEVVQSIPSTNSYLLSQGVTQGRARVCLAESQSAGRGRRGNHWQSAPYRNLMLSLSWGFDHWPDTITGLGLAVALTVSERLNSDYGVGVAIKWPNDLLVDDKKLAGILVDVAGESTSACHVVIGVGLNIHQPDWSTQDSDYQWVDLTSLGVQCDRNVLAANLINDLLLMLSEFGRHGFDPLVERWTALSSYAGRRIRVIDGETSVIGMMQGVDRTGALLLSVAGDEIRFADSSVSVRLVD